MRNRIYDEDFKLDCVKYCAEHLELSQAEAAKNLNVPEKTLNRWLVNSKRNSRKKLCSIDITSKMPYIPSCNVKRTTLYRKALIMGNRFTQGEVT